MGRFLWRFPGPHQGLIKYILTDSWKKPNGRGPRWARRHLQALFARERVHGGVIGRRVKAPLKASGLSVPVQAEDGRHGCGIHGSVRSLPAGCESRQPDERRGLAAAHQQSGTGTWGSLTLRLFLGMGVLSTDTDGDLAKTQLRLES